MCIVILYFIWEGAKNVDCFVFQHSKICILTKLIGMFMKNGHLAHTSGRRRKKLEKSFCRRRNYLTSTMMLIYKLEYIKNGVLQ